MKKILNWTFGGFFRTIGRTLAFLLLGALLFYLLQVSGFKLPSYLSIMRVNAATSESFSVAQSRLYIDHSGVEDYTSWQNVPYTQSVSYPVTQMQYRLKATDGFYADNTYRFKISYQPNPDALNVTGIWFSDGTNTLTDVMCSGWARTSSGYYETICTISPDIDISSSNYLYARLVFNSGYVNSVRSYVGNFEESKGVTSAINDQTIEIVNNQNENTQEIINNQNQNTQAIINSNKSCSIIDKNSCSVNGYINAQGNIINSSSNCVTNYINISNGELKFNGVVSSGSADYYCFYDINKSKISCTNFIGLSGDITIPSNAFYFRSTISISRNLPTYYVCKNGSQAIEDTLNDDNVDESINTASDFFSNFTTSTHGLTGIITAPLSAIESLTTATCSPLTIPLPYINQNLSLPCMRTIYENNFGSFMTIYDAVTLGIISYWILVRIFSLVKDFKNPEHDEIEVVDL